MHVIEPATSGRAKCRGCSQPIAKGELRFGERMPNPYGDGEMTLWFHLPCGAYKRPEPLLEALESTEADDRGQSVPRVQSQVRNGAPTPTPFERRRTSSYRASAVPKLPRGHREKDLAHLTRLLRRGSRSSHRVSFTRAAPGSISRPQRSWTACSIFLLLSMHLPLKSFKESLKVESMSRLAVIMGDPTGIGPEVTLKALVRIHHR